MRLVPLTNPNPNNPNSNFHVFFLHFVLFPPEKVLNIPAHALLLSVSSPSSCRTTPRFPLLLPSACYSWPVQKKREPEAALPAAF